MRPSRALLVLLSFLAVLAVSCSKDEYGVSSVQVQPYVKSDSTMGLSIYVIPELPSGKKGDVSIQMTVKSPDGNLSWSFKATSVKFDGIQYYGSSDIRMPTGTALPKGPWKGEVVFKDGSATDIEFDVSYTDAASALARYLESGSAEPWFDERSNLTVLP